MQKKILEESLKQIKPTKSFWGISSVIFVFILPEIVAFIWGGDITAFADAKLALPIELEEEYMYKGLKMLLGEGSWLNLIIGVVILIWAFF
jgi:hypothetical protein